MSSFRLGKKLEATAGEKAKLLEAGNVFYSKCGTVKYYYDENITGCFQSVDSSGDSRGINCEWQLQWYYPAKTYTINGVDLIDERINFDDALDRSISAFISDSLREHKYTVVSLKDHKASDLEYWTENNLLHKTQEAAIAHTQAMIRVEGE